MTSSKEAEPGGSATDPLAAESAQVDAEAAETERQARLQELRELARPIFHWRNAVAVPIASRPTIKAETRGLLREAIHSLRLARNALMSGNFASWKVLLASAQSKLRPVAAQYQTTHATVLYRFDDGTEERQSLRVHQELEHKARGLAEALPLIKKAAIEATEAERENTIEILKQKQRDKTAAIQRAKEEATKKTEEAHAKAKSDAGRNASSRPKPKARKVIPAKVLAAMRVAKRRDGDKFKEWLRSFENNPKGDLTLTKPTETEYVVTDESSGETRPYVYKSLKSMWSRSEKPTKPRATKK